MKGVPQGRYTREFRQEAVRLVMVRQAHHDGREAFITGGRPSVIPGALNAKLLGEGS